MKILVRDGVPTVIDDLTYAASDPNKRFVVADVAAPAVTDQQVAVSDVQLVSGTWTQVWTVRAKTADELRKTWPTLEFWARFTATERAEAKGAIPEFYEALLAAHEVISDDPLTIAGLDALVALGIITTERKAQLLA